MNDLYQQPGESTPAYAERMLSIIRILHGRVQIAAGRHVDMDDVIAELEAIENGDGKVLAEIDLIAAVATLQEYATDGEIMNLVEGILIDAAGIEAVDRGDTVDLDTARRRIDAAIERGLAARSKK